MVESERASRFVPDASALIGGGVVDFLRARGPGLEVWVAEATAAELEALAAANRETGLAGLEELRRVREEGAAAGWPMTIEGERPRGRLLELRDQGELAAAARHLAQIRSATLLTTERAQAAACDARGVPVHLLARRDIGLEGLGVLEYFDEQTMSVHLRARAPIRVKRGTPGAMRVEALGEEPLEEARLEALARQIVEVAEQHPDGFVESDGGGSTVVQLGPLRIAIARPPFADAMEITVVRPVARTQLADYRLAELLLERISQHQRGVLVAGAPGAGKSTFVQAVADELETGGWVIKTMERPRDLVVSDNITQYTALEGDMANTADVLLLVRPDYTIFDEMRRTPDFLVFADMRLAGVGMIGVVHATRGIDALQRLVGRIELGMIPQVVDTVVYIDGGDVAQVYEVHLTVKAPTGIMDEGLARPVIEVTNHETRELEYEIYTFAQQVVVMPVGDVSTAKPVWALAERQLASELRRHVKGRMEVELVSDDSATVYVEERAIGLLVGRGGVNIRELEDHFGLHFDVRPLGERHADAGAHVNVEVDDETVTLTMEPSWSGRTVEVTAAGEVVFLGAVSRRGEVTLRRGTRPAEAIAHAVTARRAIRARRV